MTGDPRIDHYRCSGGDELMLRFGPKSGPVVIVAMPLWEEANRTRAFAVAVLRGLARMGIAGVLPDLPGTGESLVETRDATLANMRDAFATLSETLAGGGPVHGVAVRSGCLLDSTAVLQSRWHLSPQTGEEVLRELWRVREAGAENRRPLDLEELVNGEGEAVAFAGNLLSRQGMLAQLRPSVPAMSGTAPLRRVRLTGHQRPADLHLPGTPLWRRAEPDNDMSLVQSVAADIAQWIAACGG